MCDLILFKEEEDQIKSYEKDANCYLVDTIDFDDFLDVLRKAGEYGLTLSVHTTLVKMNYILINSRVEKGRI